MISSQNVRHLSRRAQIGKRQPIMCLHNVRKGRLEAPYDLGRTRFGRRRNSGNSGGSVIGAEDCGMEGIVGGAHFAKRSAPFDKREPHTNVQKPRE